MKKIFFIVLVCINLFASNEEVIFWDNVKNSGDIELLKLYKNKYPHGLFDSIANLKIKRLKSANNNHQNTNIKPTWLKGETTLYKYYGVGKANKHFRGIEYQNKLAYDRAKREFDDRLDEYDMSNQELQIEKYIDKNGRIYILLYIEK